MKIRPIRVSGFVHPYKHLCKHRLYAIVNHAIIYDFLPLCPVFLRDYNVECKVCLVSRIFASLIMVVSYIYVLIGKNVGQIGL